MRGGSPAMKCRSEPRFSCTSINSGSICATSVYLASAGGTRRRRRGGRRRRARRFDLRQHGRVGNEFLEWTFVARVAVGVVRIDAARCNRRQQRLIEQLHAEVTPHLQLAWNLVGLLGLDE